MITDAEFLAFLDSYQSFLRAETEAQMFGGSQQVLRAAAGDVLVILDGRLLTVSGVYQGITGRRSSTIPEIAERDLAYRCREMAERLGPLSGRALRHFSGCADADLAAVEEEALDAILEAHEALYGRWSDHI